MPGVRLSLSQKQRTGPRRTKQMPLANKLHYFSVQTPTTHGEAAIQHLLDYDYSLIIAFSHVTLYAFVQLALGPGRYQKSVYFTSNHSYIFTHRYFKHDRQAFRLLSSWVERFKAVL